MLQHHISTAAVEQVVGSNCRYWLSSWRRSGATELRAVDDALERAALWRVRHGASGAHCRGRKSRFCCRCFKSGRLLPSSGFSGTTARGGRRQQGGIPEGEAARAAAGGCVGRACVTMAAAAVFAALATRMIRAGLTRLSQSRAQGSRAGARAMRPTGGATKTGRSGPSEPSGAAAGGGDAGWLGGCRLLSRERRWGDARSGLCDGECAAAGECPTKTAEKCEHGGSWRFGAGAIA